ncbi:unnamed protein product, partial [marine sediment metagenome]
VSYFAPVDLSGFPKDRYYLYQSNWTKEPMVHVLPHWNWEGMEGEMIPVFSYTNCEEVELYVNGKSAGRKVKGVDYTEIPAEFHEFEKGMYKTKYRLSWEVPYQPGRVKVVAYNGGEAVAEKEIKTAGDPAQITLSADRKEIAADGKDLSFITVRIEDKDGNFCPLANNLVKFNVTGEGVMACTKRINAHALHDLHLPLRRPVIHGRSQGTEVMVHAYTLEFYSPSIQFKSFICCKLDGSYPEFRGVFIKQFSTATDPVHKIRRGKCNRG